MARGSAHVSGGMSRGWLSEIGKSDRVSSRVKAVADETLRLARSAEDSKGRRAYDFKETVAGPGIWNSTYIIHPTSYMARKDRSKIDTAALKAGAKLRGYKR